MESKKPPADAQIQEAAAERSDWLQAGDGKRYRGWHLCLNNPSDDDREAYVALSKKATYMIVANEVGKECGTPHFQGFVYFTNARTQKAILKDLKGRGYVKKSRCSAAVNTAYCEKQGDVFIREGTMPEQGGRTDIKRVIEAVERGDSMTQIIQDVAVNYQDIQIAKEAMKVLEPPRRDMPEVYWYHGPSGTGKSRDAVAEAEGEDGEFSVYSPLAFSGKFWDGYDGQDHIVIHDFRPGWVPFAVLLQMLDRYEFRVENKGGSRQLRAKKIYITSPFSPEACVPFGEEAYQLLRRIKVIREYAWPVNSAGDEEDRYEPVREFKMVGASPCPSSLYESDDESQLCNKCEQICTLCTCANAQFKSVCDNFFSRRGSIDKDAHVQIGKDFGDSYSPSLSERQFEPDSRSLDDQDFQASE